MHSGKSSNRSLMSASRSAVEDVAWLDATHAAKTCKAASIITYEVMVAPPVAPIMPRIASSAIRILSALNEYDPSAIVISFSLRPSQRGGGTAACAPPPFPLSASAGEGPPKSKRRREPPPMGVGKRRFPRFPAAGNFNRAPSLTTSGPALGSRCPALIVSTETYGRPLRGLALRHVTEVALHCAQNSLLHRRK